MDNRLSYTPAGRIRRLLAAIIDIVPVYLLCFGFAYFFTGFDEAWKHRGDPVMHSEYLWRHTILRASSFLLYILYGTLMEASSLHATFGKKLMRLQVLDTNGQPVSLKTALVRNLNKIVSFAVLGLGIIWILFDRRRLAWHDILSETMVVNRRLNLPPEATF
ncbi:MAG: RDD family protein [Flavobacteriales bacterium]